MDQTSSLSLGDSFLFSLIKRPLSHTFNKNGISASYLKFEDRKNYTSAMFNSSVIIRFTIKSDLTISVPTSITPKFDTYSSANITAAKDYTKIRFSLSEVLNQQEFIKELLAQVTQNFIDKLPKEFDCCSRYVECSNAKHCIHPDGDFSLKCGYRKILQSGKIYYGANRNID